MDKQLFIPDKIAVGFQKRDDTYTKKLAYVIYYDLKGELRKEKSWNTWRDSKIAPIDYANEPTEGFVLNKKVGGHRSHWNYRDAHVRVYDPRDFEFEISVPNLLYILTQCDCSRGKGLEGKFVYAWDGTELVLLPATSEEYKQSKSFTILQNQAVKAKELVAGASYITKKQEVLTYVGRYDYHDIPETGYKPRPALSKKYIFWNGKAFLDTKDVKLLAATVQLEATPDLAELVDHYYKSPHGSPVVELFTKDIPKSILKKRNYWRSDYVWVYEGEDITTGDDPPVVISKTYVECHSRYDNYEGTGDVVEIESRYKYHLKDGVLTADYHNASAYKPGTPKQNRYYGSQSGKWHEPTGKALWAKLESGAEYQVVSGHLMQKGNKNGEDED